MSRRAARFRLLLRYGFGLWLLLAAAGCGILGDDARRDADLVYCLDPGNRAELVRAASALGLARPGTAPDHVIVSGREMTIEEWRSAHGRDFERGCAALATSARPPTTVVQGTGLDSVVGVLLPVLAGALLSWLSAEARARSITAQMEADNLRSAVRAYVNACNALGRAWSGPIRASRPDDEPVRRRHDDVDAQLRRCAVLHRRWKVLARRRRELAELTNGTLREDQVTDWADLDDSERPEYAREIRSRLETFEADTERIAEALERPWRVHRSMRKPRNGSRHEPRARRPGDEPAPPSSSTNAESSQ
jgi:hypothetical protein